jgi:hypothetical protein
MDHADPAYLAAKRTVDDRAIDRRVRDRTLDELPAGPRILEAGAGTGVTVERLLAWGITEAEYRGVDRDADAIAAARDRAAALDGQQDGATTLDVTFERGDALTAFEGERADLVLAQAFLDLVPIRRAVDALTAALRPGGLLYAPITFDGDAVFLPEHPADGAVIGAYHDHIDDRPGRDVRAGRHLLDHLRRRDGDLLAAGASDWLVHPRDGGYPADERAFLDTILDFVATAVEGVPGSEAWLRTRRDQLDDGDLAYVAHGYDVCYRTPVE